jgi:hypothetical protein
MDATNNNYVERRRLADKDMLESLVARCARADRDNVEEEELDEHPLLAGTSAMHYLSSPSGVEDFPGYNERVARWMEAVGKQVKDVEPGRAPFYFDVHKQLSSTAIFEYIWRGREAFIEKVIAHANQDVIGYWFKPGMSLALEGLLGLCACTKGGLMLSDDPNLRHTVVFSYKEIEDKQSRFAAVCQAIQDQFLVPTFFLYDFSPIALEKIRARFPTSRIIGIVCPAPNVEQMCMGILKRRQQIGQVAKDAQANSARHASKYG